MIQYAEESRLQPGTQLWSRQAALECGVRPFNDAGLPGGSGSAIVLPIISGSPK